MTQSDTLCIIVIIANSNQLLIISNFSESVLNCQKSRLVSCILSVVCTKCQVQLCPGLTAFLYKLYKCNGTVALHLTVKHNFIPYLDILDQAIRQMEFKCVVQYTCPLAWTVQEPIGSIDNLKNMSRWNLLDINLPWMIFRQFLKGLGFFLISCFCFPEFQMGNIFAFQRSLQ